MSVNPLHSLQSRVSGAPLRLTRSSSASASASAVSDDFFAFFRRDDGGAVVHDHSVHPRQRAREDGAFVESKMSSEFGGDVHRILGFFDDLFGNLLKLDWDNRIVERVEEAHWNFNLVHHFVGRHGSVVFGQILETVNSLGVFVVDIVEESEGRKDLFHVKLHSVLLLRRLAEQVVLVLVHDGSNELGHGPDVSEHSSGPLPLAHQLRSQVKHLFQIVSLADGYCADEVLLILDVFPEEFGHDVGAHGEADAEQLVRRMILAQPRHHRAKLFRPAVTKYPGGREPDVREDTQMVENGASVSVFLERIDCRPNVISFGRVADSRADGDGDLRP